MMQCARSHLCKVQEPYAENAYRLQLHLYRGNNSTYRSRRAGHCDGATRGARTDTKVAGKCTNDKLWGKVFPFRVCRSNRYRIRIVKISIFFSFLSLSLPFDQTSICLREKETRRPNNLDGINLGILFRIFLFVSILRFLFKRVWLNR